MNGQKKIDIEKPWSDPEADISGDIERATDAWRAQGGHYEVMPKAEVLSALLDNDGQTFEASDGRKLDEIARHMDARVEREFDKTRYTFPDDSIITVAGDGWDFGYPDCWCWQGSGHNDDCPESPNYEPDRYEYR